MNDLSRFLCALLGYLLICMALAPLLGVRNVVLFNLGLAVVVYSFVARPPKP